jgi:hypothetical protein
MGRLPVLDSQLSTTEDALGQLITTPSPILKIAQNTLSGARFFGDSAASRRDAA